MTVTLSFFCPTGLATAQQYPTKPIRLIIPFRPGGPRDIQACLIGPKLTEAWGQPVVIDNRAGANGIIGTELAAKAPPLSAAGNQGGPRYSLCWNIVCY
jgi:tripartite-type tricarboxylate transporter receptor subunit TctC